MKYLIITLLLLGQQVVQADIYSEIEQTRAKQELAHQQYLLRLAERSERDSKPSPELAAVIEQLRHEDAVKRGEEPRTSEEQAEYMEKYADAYAELDALVEASKGAK